MGLSASAFASTPSDSIFFDNTAIQSADDAPIGNFVSGRYVNTVNPKASVMRSQNGSFVMAGRGKDARVFTLSSHTGRGGVHYSEMANKYKRVLGDAVNVYCMVIPTQGAFYCPDGAAAWNGSQRDVIDYMYRALSDSVRAVDVFTTLGEHAAEGLYSRTDHHWNALGAYYAARQFARVAGVPFRDLSHYDTLVVHGFCGTMPQFSKDARMKAELKANPEDFVYYVPKDSCYRTQAYTYSKNSAGKWTGVSELHDVPFFRTYKDGSSQTYCTFIGGDSNTTQVKTDTHNGRRLMIMKDSFGNAIPGFLFYSFEEIHIVDFRYFHLGIRDYVRDNGITDLLISDNLGHACSKATSAKYETLLAR